jgi:hypothetical protein
MLNLCFQSSVTVTATAPEAVIVAPAVLPARGGGALGSSRMKTDAITTAAAAGLKTSVATSLSTSSLPVPAPAVTTVSPSVRSRDPRLASRQLQSNAVSANHTSQPQDEEMEEHDSIFEPVKLETAKPKPQITINLGCANKGTVNKETRRISRKDPRLISNKVHGFSNTRGRTSSAPSSGVGGKGGGKLSGRVSSPLPSSPSRPSISSGGGKTSTSPSSSSSSQHKTQSKGGNNGSTKLPRNKPLPKIIKIDLTDSPPPKAGDAKEESSRNKENTENRSKSSSPSYKTENHKKKSSPVGTGRSSSERKKGLGKAGSESADVGGNSGSNKREQAKSPLVGEKRHTRDHDRSSSSKYDMFVELEGDSPSPPPPPVISVDGKRKEDSSTSKGTVFKDVKLPKGRNYVRRNLPGKSRSPEVPQVATTGDVDLRLGGPPEKHPRLDMFQPDTNASLASTEEDIKSKLTEFQSSLPGYWVSLIWWGLFLRSFALYYGNSLCVYFIFVISSYSPWYV